VRPSTTTVGDAEVKTITVEGGSGSSRGELAGSASGNSRLGASASSQTSLSTNTRGNTGGNGFITTSTVRTDPSAGTKDTEQLSSRGNDQGTSSGSSSGTIGDDSTDLSFNGNLNGSSGGTTSRTTTSAAPGARIHTTVTSTDDGGGNMNSGGTLQRQDGHTERSGNYNGNSNGTATVAYTHQGNFGSFGQPRSYVSSSGCQSAL
jgi:hypothetical protein